MAITLERALRYASRGAYTAVGSKDISHEKFLDALDRIDPGKTPFSSLAANEVDLKAVDFKRNVDDFPSPLGAVGRADGDTTGTAVSATDNIRPIGNIAQGFARPWSIGWQTLKIANIAGVPDIEAYHRMTYYNAMKTDYEVAMTSFDQVAVYDQGTGLGAVGAGYLKLTEYANRYTAASAFAMGKPTDRHYAPTAACLTGVLTSVATRAGFKSIALALRTAAKQKGDWMLIAGLSLRQQVTDLTNPAHTTTESTATSFAAAPDQVRVFLRNEQDGVLGGSVDTIQTDFGRIFVTDTDYLGTTTTDSTGGALTSVNTAATARALASFVGNANKGILVKKGNVFKNWSIPPYTEMLGKDGSGDRYEAKALLAWGVRNPIMAGWLNLTAS